MMSVAPRVNQVRASRMQKKERQAEACRPRYSLFECFSDSYGTAVPE
jgi:hypothetical protein